MSSSTYTATVSSSVFPSLHCRLSAKSRVAGKRLLAIAIETSSVWRFAWRRKKVKLGQVQRAFAALKMPCRIAAHSAR